MSVPLAAFPTLCSLHPDLLPYLGIQSRDQTAVLEW